ncbi:MAG: PaaI family thioesterase [Patulibacter sp.]
MPTSPSEADPAAASTAPPQVGDPSSWGPERSRTVSWHDPGPTALVGLQMSGLDYMRAMLDGELPSSPIARLIGIDGGDVGEGWIEFRCVPDESTYNPLGIVHGGLMCTLLDSVAGCAVHTTLPAGVGYTSLEIKVSYLRMAHAGAELRARGKVVKPGSRVAFAEAEILGPDDKLIATASSSFLIMRP